MKVYRFSLFPVSGVNRGRTQKTGAQPYTIHSAHQLLSDATAAYSKILSNLACLDLAL
jgi:hypothetical protein